MKVKPANTLVALLTFFIGSYAAVGLGSDSVVQQQAQSSLPPAGTENAAQPVETENQLPAAAESADTETASTPEISQTPINGAFAIPLGETFSPWMVTKIVSQEAHQYKGKGEPKTEYSGTQYTVEPHLPNQYFNVYSLNTNKDGVIYAISAEQLPAEKASACETTKEIAAYLTSKYGKPRGKGMLGDWYAFRESASGPYRGIRLYAQRCRNGRYSIVYSDDAAMMREAPQKVEPEEMRGL